MPSDEIKLDFSLIKQYYPASVPPMLVNTLVTENGLVPMTPFKHIHTGTEGRAFSHVVTARIGSRAVDIQSIDPDDKKHEEQSNTFQKDVIDSGYIFLNILTLDVMSKGSLYSTELEDMQRSNADGQSLFTIQLPHFPRLNEVPLPHIVTSTGYILLVDETGRLITLANYTNSQEAYNSDSWGTELCTDIQKEATQYERVTQLIEFGDLALCYNELTGRMYFCDLNKIEDVPAGIVGINHLSIFNSADDALLHLNIGKDIVGMAVSGGSLYVARKNFLERYIRNHIGALKSANDVLRKDLNFNYKIELASSQSIFTYQNKIYCVNKEKKLYEINEEGQIKELTVGAISDALDVYKDLGDGILSFHRIVHQDREFLLLGNVLYDIERNTLTNLIFDQRFRSYEKNLASTFTHNIADIINAANQEGTVVAVNDKIALCNTNWNLELGETTVALRGNLIITPYTIFPGKGVQLTGVQITFESLKPSNKLTKFYVKILTDQEDAVSVENIRDFYNDREVNISQLQMVSKTMEHKSSFFVWEEKNIQINCNFLQIWIYLPPEHPNVIKRILYNYNEIS